MRGTHGCSRTEPKHPAKLDVHPWNVGRNLSWSGAMPVKTACTLRCWTIAFAIVFALTTSHRATAQRPAADVVFGRVTDDSGHAALASVKVTRGSDRYTLESSTDSTGYFRLRFEPGTGDYLVYVSAPGFQPTRRRIQRQASEHELLANFSLIRSVEVLDAVKVTAVKPVRAEHRVAPGFPEPGSAETWSDGVNGQLPPTLAGNLAGIAGTQSSVTVTAGGISILGSGPSSSLTTLNGSGFAAGTVPRAAPTQTRITSTTYDATRGGFAGSNIDVRLGPGDRNYQRRTAYLTLDPLSLQRVDGPSGALGARNGGIHGSVGADGEIFRRVATYNVAFDVARTFSDVVPLSVAGARALVSLGASPDSVARLLAISPALGVPTSGFGAPARTSHESINWLGRVDDTRDSLRTRALTTYAGLTRDEGIGLTPLVAPSSGGQYHDYALGGQLLLTDLVGPGHRALTETRLSASALHTQTNPYAAIPGANILLRSHLASGSDESSLSLGGGPSLSARSSQWSIEGANETAWNAQGRRHRFKASLWSRADGLRRDDMSNSLGTFTYSSLADFARARPSSFSRTLSSTAGTGAVWNAAGALAYLYAPTRAFSLLSGVRLEGNGFFSHPSENSAVESALMVRTGEAPPMVHVSPRIGFSYTYNHDQGNVSGTSATPVGLYYRPTVGVISGGIGDFRDLLRPGVLADATMATGLPGAAVGLLCVGSTVPSIAWSSFGDPRSIPSACANGARLLGNSAPVVSLISSDYQVPHSWRASLKWTTNVKSWLFKAEGLASYDLALPSVVDVNFSGAPRFLLSEEASRPVFVPLQGIDTASALISPVGGRRSESFGQVTTLLSDLRGFGSQMTLSASPDVMHFDSGISLYVSASYTRQESRRQFRGSDVASFGNPSTIEWAPNANDARHVLVLTGGFSTTRAGVFTMFSRFQSGLPFTPIVLGDINGDGRSGDRAFVPALSAISDSAVAASLGALLTGGSSTARHCLALISGQIPGLNECRGPWSQSVNVQWSLPTPARWGDRFAPSLYLQNVFAGLDQLVHGQSSVHGWGAGGTVDPVLFVPRSFDATAQSYHYDVNPRFAEVRPAQGTIANPFRLVIDVSVNLSTPYDLQQLRRALEPVRVGGVLRRRSADSVAAFYLTQTSDIYRLLLSESDSLLLTSEQVLAIRRADSLYSAEVWTVYQSLGELLARSGDNAGSPALESVNVAQRAYWHTFWKQPELAAAILTPLQRTLIAVLGNMLGTDPKIRENKQIIFDFPVLPRVLP